MPPALVIFDLDGTLADSYPWFLRHVNDVADRFGFRRIADGDIEALRHAGSRDILRRLDVPLWKVPAIARHMRRLKAASLADIALFPGVDAMLRTLGESGVRLALVSSDHEANARAQLGDANAALFSDFACGASLFGKPAEIPPRAQPRRRRSRARHRDRRRGARHRGGARSRHRLRGRDLGLCRARRAARARAGLRLRADG